MNRSVTILLSFDMVTSSPQNSKKKFSRAAARAVHQDVAVIVGRKRLKLKIDFGLATDLGQELLGLVALDDLVVAAKPRVSR